ncbi:PorP/SprF family type IX secretion system membrane protein [Segetibacter sp.]|jgi:type IX secretion system PorP/SprF family membrane protein|uniref:PorP/SprF family type IX secretion system membrane protein n=1 Tax=Segetibacter sp. TaxID=2231182 RepID=UPI0026238869|nr:PorP/SprF family type IX secretion system membrane protein [Segetibacter sp.]MCW3081427.1 type secretion system rane protein PorP/SprF [Segetibacter sp.]
MTKLRNFLIGAIVLAFFIPTIAGGQDIHFSQFFEAPLLRNPSLAGIFNGDIRVQGVYRNQWGSVTVPYKTGSFNLEYKKPIGQGDDFITTGLQLVYDKAGSTNFTTSNVLPALNYHKSLGSNKSTYLSLGFMGGLVQRRIDRSKMTTNSQFDGNGFNPSLADGESFVNDNFSYLDGSVGMTFNSAMSPDRPQDNYFIGVAYHHFNRPRNSFYRRPEIELSPKWVYSTGVRFGVSETSYMTIQADHTTQGPSKETVGGVMYSTKIGDDYQNPDYTLHFGGFLRLNDAFIPVIKLDYNPFSIAFSYDVNVSQLRTASQGQGGLELSVTYIGFFDRDNSSKNATRCPTF